MVGPLQKRVWWFLNKLKLSFKQILTTQSSSCALCYLSKEVGNTYSLLLLAFLISSIFVCFFPKISIPSLILLICVHMLSTLSIRSLSISIIIVLKSQSDNSNIPTRSGFDPRPCCVSSNCVVVVCRFSIPCNFFLHYLS